MKLRRRDLPPGPISLVSMIDVLMIMLIFFMVTSTFLDLDMIPLVDGGGAAAGAPAQDPATVVVRLGADGMARLRGAALDPAALAAALAALEGEPALVILPSAQATTQALVSVMEAAADAGIAQIRVLRLEPAP